jgi:alkanesulfonate monooxygenase SsuD/methylene tetrahydromethanopterin reductase-like flavin-dependent oxidoreductase (luciferase family)
MEFDLFMEFASPVLTEKHSTRTIVQVYEENIELAKIADREGFGAVWSAEHHFVGDYSNAAAPEILLSAIARETRQINLGFAILPLPLHEPVRVAEKLATLDALSGGRVLWGVGRGVTATELGGFGIEMSDSRQIFKERFAQLQDILETGQFVRDGETYELRPRPESSLGKGWLAAVSPSSTDLAAELGLNLLTGPFKPWPMVRSDIKRYRKQSPEGQTSFTMAVYCERDHEAARRKAEPGIVWVYKRLLEFARPLLSKQIEGYEHYRKLAWIANLFSKSLSLSVLEKMGLAAVGSPEHVAKRMAILQKAGVDRVGLAIGGGDLSIEDTSRSVELIAREVMPKFQSAQVIPINAGAA